MIPLRWMIFAGLSLGLAHGAVRADDALATSPEQRLEFASQTAGRYRFRIIPPKTSEGTPRDAAAHDVKLQPKPLLRWNNHVVREDDGLLFLWTEGDKGRPVAAAQFFLVATDWNHEFQSLTPGSFEASAPQSAGGLWNWGPTTAGISFVAADSIDPPSDSPNQRLRQMKSIAERFTAAVDPEGRFESPEELRLLTTPIYRYSARDDGIVDGALFIFAQGTNPEIMLLIEAAESGTMWRYGFARMSCFHLRVRRDKQIVWQRDRAPVPTQDRASPYFFRAKAELDGSALIKDKGATRE